MKATRLLLEACKRNVIVGCLLAAVTMTLFGLGWFHYEDLLYWPVPSMSFYAFRWTLLAAAVAACCQILSCIYGALRRLPVPVTPSQLTYVPFLAGLIYWGVAQGVLSVFFLLDMPTNTLDTSPEIWPAVLQAAPFALLILAVSTWISGGVSLSMWFVPLVLFLSCRMLPYSLETLTWFADHMWIAQGLALLAAIFILASTPVQRRVMGLATHCANPSVLPFLYVVMPFAPLRLPRWRIFTGWALFVAYLSLMVYCLAVYAAALFSDAEFSEYKWYGYVLVASAFVLLVASIVFKFSFNRFAAIQCSSVSPYTPTSQWTLKLIDKTSRAGRHAEVNDPNKWVSYCPACRRFEPVWDRTCGKAIYTPDLTKKTKYPFQPRSYVMPFYHGLALFFLTHAVLFLQLLMVGNSRIDGNSELVRVRAGVDRELVQFDRFLGDTLTETTFFVKIPPEAAPLEMQYLVRNFLNAHSDATTWVSELQGEDGQGIALPEHSRITIQNNFHAKTIEITTIGLRWETPEFLGLGLARALAAHFGSAPPVRTYTIGDYPPRVSADTLDNNVYWIAGDQKTLLLVPGPSTGPSPVYVDARNTEGWENGTSWGTAFDTLQEGLDAARRRGDVEVWVAEGRYAEARPHRGALRLWDGLRLYGGFQGHETQQHERDPQAYPTTIDGSVAQAGSPAPTVVEAQGDFVLDGFTIRGGDGPVRFTDRSTGLLTEAFGGGLTMSTGLSLVRECLFVDNTARDAGGAILVRGGELRVVDTTFRENTSRVMGGAVCVNGGRLSLVDCTFEKNSATRSGGALAVARNFQTPAGCTIERCEFRENQAPLGGAILISSSKVAVTSSRFIENQAERGAVIAIHIDTWEAMFGSLENASKEETDAYWNDRLAEIECTLSNCLLAGNTSTTAASIVDSGIFTIRNCTITANSSEDHSLFFDTIHEDSVVANSIFWENGPGTLPPGTRVIHSVFQGGASGLGNLDSDPRFVDPEHGDYRLRADSPAIDAGNSENTSVLDLDGNPRVQGESVDMGAYEYVPE